MAGGELLNGEAELVATSILISLSGAGLERAVGTPLQVVGLGATGGVYTGSTPRGCVARLALLP